MHIRLRLCSLLDSFELYMLLSAENLVLAANVYAHFVTASLNSLLILTSLVSDQS